MVGGVCWRMLSGRAEAEDCYQATFLVLLRKADAVRPRARVGAWLHGVAYHTALKARHLAARRGHMERQVERLPEPIPKLDANADLRQLLDRGLNELPEKYRIPIVLCELEGRTLKEAALELGCPLGTLAGRLARGRDLLARRLARYGPAVSGVSLAAVLAQQAAANAPSIHVIALPSSGAISANAVALAEGVIRTMLLTKLAKLTAVALLAVACCGFGYLAHSSLAAGQTPAPEQLVVQNAPLAPSPPPARLDIGAKPVAPKETSDAVAQAGKDKEKKDDKKDEKKARTPAFTVGKETTYVLGPLDKAGRIDYETALNEKLREGVTPDNNAVVLLFKAFGPHPDDAKLPEGFFKWMKVPAPAEKGDYFVNVNQFRRDHLKANPPSNAFEEALDKAMVRPWAVQEHPDVAAWLKLNEKPLAVASEASKRTHFYYPTLGHRKDGKTQGLISAQIAGVQQCRQLAGALTARAMLRVSEKLYDDAWQDLLASHRLGRLVGRGGTLIESLVGIALDRMASDADAAFLDAAKLDAKKLKACLRDLQDLPPMPSIADKIDVTERYCALESIMLVDRDGIAYLEMVGGSKGDQDPLAKMIGKFVAADVQWDPALRNMNKIYDRMAAALRVKDLDKRNQELRQVERDIVALKGSLTEAKDIARTILGAKSISRGEGEIYRRRDDLPVRPRDHEGAAGL